MFEKSIQLKGQWNKRVVLLFILLLINVRSSFKEQ